MPVALLFPRYDHPAIEERYARRLPKPPARILEVGTGLGTTLARLTRAGYDATGITPDEKQIAVVRSRYGDTVRVEQIAFESLASRPFDVVVFQESSQYQAARIVRESRAARSRRHRHR